MKAELIFSGSELLQGRVLNTNAQYLGRRLFQSNVEVGWHVTVGDNMAYLKQVLRQAMNRADLILITGGLGPTSDDLTKDAVAELLDLPMVLDDNSLAHIKGMFEKMGMSMPESNIRQAIFPAGAIILPNKRGTAPGALIERGDQMIALLPGPPHEMSSMFEETLLPIVLKRLGSGTSIRDKVFSLTGIAESAVQDLLKDLDGQINPGISYLARPGEVQVRVAAYADSAAVAEKMVAELSEKVEMLLEEHIFGDGSEAVEYVAARLLMQKGMLISVAESCTGGLIAARLTDIPGSSDYFMGGVVAYSNELKQSLLGVAPELIEQHGAVSKQTAIAMAEGVRDLTGTNLGLAVTGIAGPDGGTATKPRGLVYIALAAADETTCRKFQFPGERFAVRRGTVNAALNMVNQYLKDR